MSPRFQIGPDRAVFIGTYRGFVIRTDDPDQQFRIKARVPQVLGDLESNWALPCFPGGANDPKLPQEGQMVWIEFENGDPNLPIWKGGMPSSYQGEQPLPAESLGDDGETVLPPRGTASVDLADGRTMKEAYPAFVGEYGDVQSRETASGHHLEVDDTPDGERLAAIHRTGNAVEMDGSGGMRRRLAKDDLLISGDKTVRVMGKRTEVCDGPRYEQNMKDRNTVDQGKVSHTLVDDLQVVLNGGENVIECNGTLTITGNGKLVLALGTALSNVVGGSLQTGVMGSQESIVVESKQEIIGNASLRPDGKKVTVVVGNYNLEALAGQMLLNGVTVRLGNPLTSVDALVKGTAFLTLMNDLIAWINTHTHPDPVSGVSGPPSVLFPLVMSPGIHTSLKVFTE